MLPTKLSTACVAEFIAHYGWEITETNASSQRWDRNNEPVIVDLSGSDITGAVLAIANHMNTSFDQQKSWIISRSRSNALKKWAEYLNMLEDNLLEGRWSIDCGEKIHFDGQIPSLGKVFISQYYPLEKEGWYEGNIQVSDLNSEDYQVVGNINAHREDLPKRARQLLKEHFATTF